ncbi:MAG: YjbQ family protein [Pirellulales bacterium]|nr:YjbQ family protein [Pirellulales bacterium]
MIWLQKELSLSPRARGCHPITCEVLAAVPEVSQIDVGILHVFLQHTSASLTLNENADPDVPLDLERSLNILASEDLPYRHTIEGPDDMPAHLKCSLTGNSLTVPIGVGQVRLGVWQGIFLWEHRRRAGSRRLLLTLFGKPK